jgi:hypothetical protein
MGGGECGREEKVKARVEEGEEGEEGAGKGAATKKQAKSGEPQPHLWSRGKQKGEGEVRHGRGR